MAEGFLVVVNISLVLETLNIPWSYTTRLCAQLNNYSGKTSAKLKTHERQPRPRPYRRAVGCLSWGIQRKMTAIYRERTVLRKLHVTPFTNMV